MKKTSRSLLAMLLIATSLFMLSACGNKVVGGYTKDRKLKDEDLVIFNKAIEGLTGVSYEPEKVATQVVAGTNYRFYCKSTPVTPNAKSSYSYVYIFVPLGENPVPELGDIVPVA